MSTPGGSHPGVQLGQLGLDHAGAELFLRTGKELGVTSFGLNVVMLRAGQRLRVHRHRRQEEVYIVLQGTLTLLAEGDEHRLVTGATARVAPEVRRQLVNRDAETCAILAIGGAEPHDGRDAEAFTSWEDHEPREPRDVPLPPDLPSP